VQRFGLTNVLALRALRESETGRNTVSCEETIDGDVFFGVFFRKVNRSAITR